MVRRSPIPPRHKLHVHRCCVCVASPLAVHEQLLDHASQELPATFPPTVEVYHEISLNRIIVEVQAHDQIGLLFRLVKTISDHGYDTTFARINTERSIAIDTFYIEPSKPEATIDMDRLQKLKEALRALITTVPTEAASA